MIDLREQLDFFDQLGKPVVVVDLEMLIRTSNRSFRGLFHVEAGENPLSVCSIIHPEDLDDCRARLAQLLDGTLETVKVQKRFRAGDNHYYWFSLIVVQWDKANAADPTFLVVFDDLSALKNAEEKLADSEARYSSYIENLPVAVFHIDLKKNPPEVYFSKQFEQIFHISAHAVDDGFLSLRKYIHPDDLRILSDSHNYEELANRQIITEFRLVNEQSETFWVRERAFIKRDVQNRVSEIHGVMMDITQEKQAQRELKRSKYEHQTLIELADDRIGVMDMDGNLIYGNNTFFRSLGLEPSEYHTNMIHLEHFHPDDLHKQKEAIRKVKRTGSASYEYRIRHRNGNYLYMYNKLTLLRDENGAPEGILTIIRDISKLKRIEKELVVAKHKAEESDRLKSAFLANMSHEIRTPLNGIIGFSKLLADQYLSEDKRNLYADIIDRNSQQLLTLISDIIDIAKIESDQLKIHPATMNLNKLLDEVYQTVHTGLHVRQNRDIDLILSKDLDDDDSNILTDKFRLAQLFNNLLNNAIKFTESGEIEFGYKYSGESFLFFVRDTGIGVAEDNQELIFNPFRQEEENITRKYGGTGLGLAICSKLVHLMGGRIWVESEKNKGSIFSFTLPLEFAEVHEVRPKPKARLCREWPGKSILIVDDNRDVLLFLSEILRDTRIEILTAESGREAIEICNWAEHIDMVLMDMQMPGMGGVETTNEIRAIYPKIPVIAQTANAMAGDDKKFLAAGCSGYISKPIDKERLCEMLSAFL